MRRVVHTPKGGTGWDWRIRSYDGGRLMLETVHQGDHSRDVEIDAIRACGRTLTVEPLSAEARGRWAGGWRP